MPDRFDVLGVGVTAVDLDSAVAWIFRALQTRATGYVCVTGVHGVMEAQDDPDLRRIHNESMLTVPDGMPLVWIARRRGLRGVGRVYGPDLMRGVLGGEDREPRSEIRSPRSEIREPRSEYQRPSDFGPRPSDLVPAPVPSALGPRPSDLDPVSPDLPSHFLLGSTPATLERLSARIRSDFPAATIAGIWAPPFRDLTDDEWGEALRRVRESGASIVWVGLSTPKQERFMAEFVRRWEAGDGTPRSEVRGPKSECWNAPISGAGSPDLGPRSPALGSRPSDLGPRSSVLLVGVGAAFDVLAGLRPDAPDWMKRAGLQWLHRLGQEPRRLGPRYLRIVPGFLWRILPDLLLGRRGR